MVCFGVMRRWLALQTFLLLMAKVASISAMQKKPHGSHAELHMSTTPSAEVYVINLKDRKDKCRCMRQQLSHAPWPAHRFNAVTMNTTSKFCPNLLPHDFDTQEKKQKAAALVCSNVQIWKKFLRESNASHLVVFEDDVILPDPRTWDKLRQLIEEPCREWDYLMVDGFGPAVNHPDDSLTRCKDGMTFMDLSYRVSGSQMQVLNRHAVQKLVDFADGIASQTPAMDRFVAKVMIQQRDDNMNRLKAFSLTAGLAPQAKFIDPDKEKALGITCNDTVWTTDDRKSLVGSFENQMLFPC